MKKLLIIATVAALTLVSCGGSSVRVKTDVDTLAYAIGVDLGVQLKSMDSTINPHIVAKGIIDAFNGKETMTRDSAVQYIQNYFMVTLPEKRMKESEDFLAGVAKKEGVKKDESGLLYQITEMGDEKSKPTDDRDTVKVKYVGTLKNGSEFDSSREDTVRFALNNVIKGWRDGLKFVGKGGKIKLWIPSELAYGQHGRPPMIGPNEALVFEVELIDVMPVKEKK